MSVYDYDKTASNNTTVGGVNVGENCAAANLNNSQRGLATEIAEWRDDISGANTSGGSANAQTLTTSGTLSTLADGRMFCFVAGYTNTGAATFKVDSTTAKALRKENDQALTGGEVVAGGVYLVAYDASANSAAGAWMLLNPTATGEFTTLSASGNCDFNGQVNVADEVVLDGSTRVVRGSTTVDSLVVSGSNSADLGGNITLYGHAHSSYPSDILFRTGTTERLRYDSSTSKWDFSQPIVTNTGTQEINGTLSFAASAGVINQADNGDLIISGGSASNTGGNIVLYGSTQATTANDILFRAGTDQVGRYDDSADVWNFNADVNISGSISKSSGTFLIDHPLDPKSKQLAHGFVEAPRYDLIYRGQVSLVSGRATICIDAASNMSAGTFEALTTNAVVSSLQNQSGFTRLRPGDIIDGCFEIICEDENSSDDVSWVVIAERNDSFIRSGKEPNTDESGRFIPERNK